MPSPFPGMDPFIESDEWTDFHVSFLVELGRILVPQVRPKYLVRRERRVYVEHEVATSSSPQIPDVAVVTSDSGATPAGSISPLDSEEISPVTLTLPMPETHHETFLTLRDTRSREVVCVIEVLSPSNKRVGSDGRAAYLDKRNEILASRANLVEIDFLRGGERLPTIEPLPAGDHYCFVSRVIDRPAVAVYAWSIRNPLPRIPIPLDSEDKDAFVDLQRAFSRVYEESGYDYSLEYRAPLKPVLSANDSAWIRQILENHPLKNADN